MLAAFVLLWTGPHGEAQAQSAEPAFPDGANTIRLLDAEGRALPTAELPEKSDVVRLELRSAANVAVNVTLRLLAAEVLGLQAGAVLKQSSHRFAPGEVWQTTFPLGALAETGRYAVEAEASDGSRAILPFALVPLQPPATLLAEDPSGLVNLALEALGGHILWASSAKSHHRGAWRAENLLDGFRRIRDERGALVSGGWQSERGDWPAEVVVGFHAGQAPLVSALVLEPAALDRWLPVDFAGTAPASESPRFVEILSSDTGEAGSFQSVTTARLWNRTAPQLVTIEPQRMRYLMLRVHESYGKQTTALAELRVFASAEDTVLDDIAVNLARPALGGGLVAFTSQTPDNPAAALVDGRSGDTLGWSSGEGLLGGASYLPQDLVFGFSGDRIAEIDRVEIDLASSPRWAVGGTPSVNWPRLVSIGVTLDGPDGPFEEIGRFTLAREPGPQSLPVGRAARFLRLRVLENHGGALTTLGEVAVIEARHPEQGSLLAGGADIGWATAGEAATAATPLPAGRAESEPNDDAATAETLQLGESLRGSIEPSGDSDRYKLSLGGEAPQTLALRLQADGELRLALTLTDRSGAVVKSFLPGPRSGRDVLLTWRLPPGEYLLSIDEPPRVTALVWDTSSSMEGRSEDQERAVRAYVEALGSHETLVLIRFADKVVAVQPTASGDKLAMLDLLAGQFRPDGGTHLYDALGAAIDTLDGATGLRSILALTDGQDSGSALPLADLRRRLAAGDLRLTAIGLGPDLADLSLGAGNSGHGVLRSLAQATGGRYVTQPSSEELHLLYAALAADFGAAQHYGLRVDAVRELGAIAVRSADDALAALVAAPRVVLVLDASGSMKRRLAGRPMIDTAQDVLADLIRALPDGIEAALWTFGHRVAEGQAGDCTDVEELVRLGPIDRERLLQRLAAVRARGTTPIGATLERIGQALPRDGGRALIVLVTDGEEECGADLTAVAQRLTQENLELSLNIVGFALDAPAVLAQLAAAAAAGNGRFVQAAAAAELAAALDEALAAPFAVLDAAGAVVAEGRVDAGALALPVGRYDLRIATRHAPLLIRGIEVAAGTTAEVRLDRQGEEIGVTLVTQKEGQK